MCCATMTLLAVITKHDVILRILSHVNLPRTVLSSDATHVGDYFRFDPANVVAFALQVCLSDRCDLANPGVPAQ